MRPITPADVAAESEAAGWRVFAGCTLVGLLLGGIAGAWLLSGMFAFIDGPGHASSTPGELFAAVLLPGFLLGAFTGTVAGAGLGTWLGVATSRAVRAELQGQLRDRAIK